MEIVILTALGVGGATVLGAVFGLIFKRTSKAFNDGAMSVAAGVMLAAAMIGLILPSLEYGGELGVITTIFGILFGALCLDFFDLIVLKRIGNGAWGLAANDSESLRRVLLFVTAIALHNLPEGIAAGVGFGTGDSGAGIFIATAIAIQNIPEGMSVIVAMLGVGIDSKKTFTVAALTGVVEIIGTFIGYFAVNLSSAVLPFVLAFAGGNMLYVIADEMIPEAHSGEENRLSTYLLLIGFSLMLLLNAFL